jgi:hypothetical protein
MVEDSLVPDLMDAVLCGKSNPSTEIQAPPAHKNQAHHARSLLQPVGFA